MNRRSSAATTSVRVDPWPYDGPIRTADGVRPYNRYLGPTESWTANEGSEGHLRSDWWLPIYALADGRYSTSSSVCSIEGNLDCYGHPCVFATRDAAIRAQAGRLMRRLRWARRQKGWPNETPAEDARLILDWIRVVVARETEPKPKPVVREISVHTNVETEIARYETGIRRAKRWVVQQELAAGVQDMRLSDPAYPARCAAGRAKLAEFEAVIAGLRAQLAEEAAPAVVEACVEEVAAPAPTLSKLDQLLGMVAEFTLMREDLEAQIEAEEEKTGNRDPFHFAYSTFAKAARIRATDLEMSTVKLERQIAAERGTAHR